MKVGITYLSWGGGGHNACRLHNLQNQKVIEINYPSAGFVIPSLSLNEKKSEACNHSMVQSVTFVSFDSRVFSIRWQSLVR